MAFSFRRRLRPLSSRLLAFLPMIVAFVGAPASMPPYVGGTPKPEIKPNVLQTPFGTTEVGVLDGSAYRIDVPTDWNHSLVVYYHGYATHGVTYQIAEKLASQQIAFFQRHYAVAQSAYSQPGWALPQAYPETEQLRKYFGRKYGLPQETYV